MVVCLAIDLDVKYPTPRIELRYAHVNRRNGRVLE
jgi:hypothetical protein